MSTKSQTEQQIADYWAELRKPHQDLFAQSPKVRKHLEHLTAMAAIALARVGDNAILLEDFALEEISICMTRRLLQTNVAVVQNAQNELERVFDELRALGIDAAQVC